MPMLSKEELDRMLINMGVGRNDIVQEYDAILFLISGEIVELCYNEFENCWNINNDEKRKMYFSQFNGIYFILNEEQTKIVDFGSAEIRLLDGTTINLHEISSADFREITMGKKFLVSLKRNLNYYIVNKKGYQKESEEFQHLIDKINSNPMEDALTKKIIKKGNCYILTEV